MWPAWRPFPQPRNTNIRSPTRSRSRPIRIRAELRKNYGNDQGVVGAIVDSLIGNRYAVGDRQAIRQCAWAAVERARGQYGGGYGQGYGNRFRVTAITDVRRRALVLRVRGTLGRGGDYGGPGYGGPGYGGPGYGGGGYARPAFNFRCDVNYNGYVQNLKLEPLYRAY